MQTLLHLKLTLYWSIWIHIFSVLFVHFTNPQAQQRLNGRYKISFPTAHDIHVYKNMDGQ